MEENAIGGRVVLGTMRFAKAHLTLHAARRLAIHCAVVLGLGCLALPNCAQAADDPWWGKDKQKHLMLSSGLAVGTYAWLGHAGLEPASRMGLTTLVVLSLGALKEARDALGYGHPSWKDMTWNVIGNAVGLVVAWVVEAWLWPGTPRPSQGVGWVW
jgi:uncharacterized protein YfiM (DUF2279 family)